uniref:Arm_2 domain-containing protein n=1 Tax=Dracunculus medinensis TaxID=318479 RepID=A0A0N4U3N3_DRAME
LSIRWEIFPRKSPTNRNTSGSSEESVPQKDPDEEEHLSQWRITVNPSANFLSQSDELRSLINRLSRSQKLVSPSEARYLCAGLQFLDTTSDLLLPLFTVISNSTAFPANQRIFLQCGITERIVSMLKNSHAVMLLQCVANMAVHNENDSILKPAIPFIIKRLDSEVDLEGTVAFQALTNLSLNIAPSQIEIFRPTIQICLKKLWIKGEVNLSALRLLVNLSCCPNMVPYVLAAKVSCFIVLRGVTWLLCLSSAVDALSITYDLIAPLNQDPFANPNYTIYFTIYALKGRKELEKRLLELSRRKDEAATKSNCLLEILARIPVAFSSNSNLNHL